MYNADQIIEAFLPLLGWRQNIDSAGTQLLELTSSESGQFYTDYHPLLTLDNLQAVAPQFDLLTVASWDAGTTYQVGDLVTSGGNTYRAILETTGNAPPDSTYWVETNLFTNWLREKTAAGILRAVQAWLGEKFTKRTARGLLEREMLFQQAADVSNTQTLEAGNVYGLEISLVRHLGILGTIRKVGVQFDTAGSFTIYLFRSGQAQAVASQAVTYTEAETLQWVDVADWEIEPSGSYYVGYLADDAPGAPINMVSDHSFPLAGLNHFTYGRFYTVSAFEVAGTPPTNFNPSQLSHSISTSYGLNLQLDVACDYTELLVEQKALFVDLVGLQVSMDMLRLMAFNPEAISNRHQRNAEGPAMLYEIDGDSQGRPGGLRHQFDQAMKRLRMDSTGIDKACLPCKRAGVKYRVV